MIFFYRISYVFSYLLFWQFKSFFQMFFSKVHQAFTPLTTRDSDSGFEFLRIKSSTKIKQKKRIVLLDEFLVPQWVLVNSVFAQVLAEESESSIATFGFNSRSNFSESLFKSFSANQHFRIAVKKSTLVRILLDTYNLLRRVKSNADLIAFKIRNVRVGLDIYESILRAGTPTVQIGSPRYLRTVIQGLVAFNFFEWVAKSNELRAVLLSHDAYIGIGLLGKVAHQHQVPVYHANPFEIIRTSHDFEIYERFREYPKYFKSLNNYAKEMMLIKAQTDLKRRLIGEVGIGLSHQTLSAFDETDGYIFNSFESRKALIATHCFYDNPHGYSEMIFTDFWDWLVFLGESTQNSTLEWYVKPHRDYLPGTLEILDKLSNKFPHLKILPADTSFHHLRRNNFEVAFTCYGSIGHELPNLGIAVVNCAYNPHIAYNFNTHCESREEILQVLEKLEESRLEINLDGIHEFYAVHNYLMRPDDFFFHSMDEYQAYVKNPLSFELCYEFILPRWKNIVNRFTPIVEDYLSQPEKNSTVYLNNFGGATND